MTHSNDDLQNITQEVLEMQDYSITGNIIPMEWYKIFTRENGKPHTTAIIILSDIVYWYRPTEIRSEQTGEVVGYKKKFRGDFFQRQTKAYSETYGFSEKQVREALKYLEDKGIIQRHFREIKINLGIDEGVLTNRQFIQLFPSVLKSFSKSLYLSTLKSIPPHAKDTYTDTITDNKAIASQASNEAKKERTQSVQEKKASEQEKTIILKRLKILENLGLNENTHRTLASSYNYEDLLKAIHLANKRSDSISDINQWLTSCLKNRYWEDGEKTKKEVSINERSRLFNYLQVAYDCVRTQSDLYERVDITASKIVAQRSSECVTICIDEINQHRFENLMLMLRHNLGKYCNVTLETVTMDDGKTNTFKIKDIS